MIRRAKKYEDPFLDEIHAVKRAVSAAAGHDVRKLAAMASKTAGARRTKRTSKKKSAA